MLARRFPKSRFVGLDIGADAIAWAQNDAARNGLSNATFLVKDAATISGPPVV